MQRNSPPRIATTSRAVSELAADLCVCVTVTLRLDANDQQPQPIRAYRSPSESLAASALARKSTAQFPTPLRSASRSLLLSDRSPITTSHAVRGLKPPVGDPNSTLIAEMDKFVVSCSSSLLIPPAAGSLLGFVMKKRAIPTPFAKPVKVEVGVPNEDFQIALTDGKWMYALCLAKNSLHVCAVNLDECYTVVMAYLAENLRRLKQEAKISQNWPRCNIEVTVPESAAPSLFSWICRNHHGERAASLNRTITATSANLILPSALCSVPIGQPQAGLMRQDLTFSISMLKSYLADQLNLKGSYVTVSKFVSGYIKQLRRRQINEIPMHTQVYARVWEPEETERISPAELGKMRVAVMTPRHRQRHISAGQLKSFEFDRIGVSLDSARDSADLIRNKPITTIKLDSLATLVD